jgi:hypothetical protein
VTLSNYLASRSRCPETLRRCRRPNRVLARRYLRSPGPRLFTPCREKIYQGLSTRRPQGSRLQRPSRRRPPLPERNQRTINRLVRLCRYQFLLKRLRPCIDLCGHSRWAGRFWPAPPGKPLPKSFRARARQRRGQLVGVQVVRCHAGRPPCAGLHARHR